MTTTTARGSADLPIGASVHVFAAAQDGGTERCSPAISWRRSPGDKLLVAQLADLSWLPHDPTLRIAPLTGIDQATKKKVPTRTWHTPAECRTGAS